MFRLVNLLVVFPIFFLTGCERLKEIDELKSNAATNSQQMIQVKNELASLRDKLLIIETNQEKTVRNDGPQPLSNEQIEKLKKAIFQCTQGVRISAPDNIFYSKFDAYYNPASGRVENNNMYQGGGPAVYAFNKCMAVLGIPLN